MKHFKTFVAIVIALAMGIVPFFSMATELESIISVEPGIVQEPSITDADLDAALNVEGGDLTFTNSATYPWEVIDSYAASGNAGVNSSTSAVSVEVTLEANQIVQFDYKVSSEANWDNFYFKVNGTTVLEGTGEVDWTTHQYGVTEAGTYTLSWEYTKDSSVGNGDDCAYLDNVYVGDPVPVSGVEIMEELSVPAGRAGQLVWTVLPEAAYFKDVIFTSGDENIATVDEDGKVRGVAEGETFVTVTTVEGGFTDTCTVYVTEALPAIWFYGISAFGTEAGSWITFPDYDLNDVTALATVPEDIFAAEFVGGVIYGYTTAGRYFTCTVDDLTPNFTGVTVNHTITDMAYNHANDRLYAIGANAEGDRLLYEVDILTGVLLSETVITSTSTIMTLAISTDGVASAQSIAPQTSAPSILIPLLQPLLVLPVSSTTTYSPWRGITTPIPCTGHRCLVQTVVPSTK
ncbi:MAG: Ig domain-containing protein [Clostridia bacterium]|nr:Ig domain-containing protein [Clostridia bacterium]